jgi:ABC-type phosphate transport system auxiliary subunit
LSSGLDVGTKQSAAITDDIVKLHNDVLSDRHALSNDDIANVYVVRGRQYGTTKKPDCVIVTLADRNRKKDFYALSASMRKNNKPVYIGDDMTAGQRQLMYELKKRKDLFTKVVYRDGTMRCLKPDGGWRNFGYLHELEKLPPQQNAAASPRAAANA